MVFRLKFAPELDFIFVMIRIYMNFNPFIDGIEFQTVRVYSRPRGGYFLPPLRNRRPQQKPVESLEAEEEEVEPEAPVIRQLASLTSGTSRTGYSGAYQLVAHQEDASLITSIGLFFKYSSGSPELYLKIYEVDDDGIVDNTASGFTKFQNATPIAYSDSQTIENIGAGPSENYGTEVKFSGFYDPDDPASQVSLPNNQYYVYVNLVDGGSGNVSIVKSSEIIDQLEGAVGGNFGSLNFTLYGY
jgi:hypothetical protein